MAMGLIIQRAYDNLDYEEMILMLNNMNLPTTLSQINIPICEETLDKYVNGMCKSTVINDLSEESKEKMKNAILKIC